MDSQSTSNNAKDIPVLLYRQQVAAEALGFSSFVREIVDRNPELALSFDEHGFTPHLAVAYGHISVIKELLDSKLGINIFCLRDKDGFFPNHTAVMKGRVDVLKVVINDTCRMLVLRESTWQGDIQFFKKLFNSVDAEGNTLLHLAMAKRQKEIIKMLVLVGKVDLNAINLKGSTALTYSSTWGHNHVDITPEEMFGREDGRTTPNISTSDYKATWLAPIKRV